MIIDWELREFMHDQDDWMFAFRNGEATANEVLDAAMESMPDFKSPRGEVASQLFRQMAEDNPNDVFEWTHTTPDLKLPKQEAVNLWRTQNEAPPLPISENQ